MKKSAIFTRSFFIVLFMTMIAHFGFAQSAPNGSGWYLTNYSFKDGTMEGASVLAGTSSQMKNIVSFKGEKGNIVITQNRFDVKTGKLLAGVTYQVNWTDPATVLVPGEKHSIDFGLKTISSVTWKAPQQSMHFNQGANGVYFIAADGTKYIQKDTQATLTTEKVIDKGNPGAKRMIQMNFGNGFVATYNYEWKEGDGTAKQIISQNTNVNTSVNGWKFTNYSFKDGSTQSTSVLAGTSSQMKDVISYKGEKGNIVITQNRFDVKTGKLLAEVTYQVNWTDPATVLVPGEKHSIDFGLKTISSVTWKAPQQSMHFNQGANGVYFIAPDGTKYIQKDIQATLTTEKVIDKGNPGAKRMIQMNFGNGFVATYNYEWK